MSSSGSNDQPGPRPEGEDWQAFWQEYYDKNEHPWVDPDEWLVAETSTLPPGRAVDLGAGEGGNSLWLASEGWEVTAVDFAPAGLAALEAESTRRGLSMRTVVEQVAEFHDDRPFDVVLLAYMHLEARERELMLTRASQLVAPGGTLLYIGLTNMEHEAPAGLEHIFAPPDRITPSLSELELERVEVRRRPLPYPTDDPDAMADGVLIRARRPRGAEGEHSG